MRTVTAAIAATGLAVALVACSSSGPSEHPKPTTSARQGIDAAAFVAQATDATRQARTVKLKATATMLGQQLTATGAERFGAKNTDASVMSSTPFGPVDVIVVGGVVYAKGLGGGEPGKPWVKNAEASQEIAKVVTEADPRRILPLLSGVGTLKPAGQQTVNGVATTHYAVTVDPSKVARNALPDLGPALAAGIRNIDVQVWVDAQKRLSRLTISLPDGPALTADYTGWGAPVTITAPPADQVTER